MPLLCLKCEERYGDDHVEPCKCGAREWLWIDAPKDELRFTRDDRAFLKLMRIRCDS